MNLIRDYIAWLRARGRLGGLPIPFRAFRFTRKMQRLFASANQSSGYVGPTIDISGPPVAELRSYSGGVTLVDSLDVVPGDVITTSSGRYVIKSVSDGVATVEPEE